MCIRDRPCADPSLAQALRSRSAPVPRPLIQPVTLHRASSSKVAAARKVQALELAAAIKGAEACDNNTGHLTSIRLRNNKPMYDGSKIRLGDLTIDDMHDRCRKLVTELKAKPAFGCGRHYLDVSQDRASIVDRWNPVRDSGKMPFEAMDCSETVSYTHLRAHETPEHLVCRL